MLQKRHSSTTEKRKIPARFIRRNGAEANMPLLTLNKASLAFGHIPLLDHSDFQLDAGERIALIGRNGTGKSSLLTVLAGQRNLDDGTVWQSPGIRMAYVPQEPVLDPALSVFHTVVAGMGTLSAKLNEYHQISHQLADKRLPQATLLDRLNILQAELEAAQAWQYESAAERIIQRFSLDPEAMTSTLSGGQKKRLALAQALVNTPDVLLLDEPTNHLDIAAIEWLENLLLENRLTLLFTTHDRCFLDRLATRIIELDRGKLTSYPGCFSEYQRRKTQLLHEETQANKKFDKFLAQEEIWIRKGVEARRTRNEGRVLRLEHLRRERSARRERQGRVNLSVDSGEKSGQLVAELHGVNKQFATRPIVKDFSCRLMRGDKIGLIGANGAGKTTLLRLILGEITPDSGKIRLGSKIQVAYFDQFRTQLDPEAALVDVISPGSDHVEIAGTRKHVISYLGDFLFSPERARSPVKSLSGGERNRLLLARLFARPANVMVLDEPTNDLDIETLELLEVLLQDYTGTLFLVSHDRSFLDNVVTQTIVAEGEGHWKEYAGGYSDWSRYRAENQKQSREANSERPTPRSEKTASPPSAAVSAKKRSYKIQRELEALPAQITALETEQNELTQALENPALYTQDAQKAHQIASRIAAIDDALTSLLERWEALEKGDT